MKQDRVAGQRSWEHELLANRSNDSAERAGESG
jgi:hypothetical protein